MGHGDRGIARTATFRAGPWNDPNSRFEVYDMLAKKDNLKQQIKKFFRSGLDDNVDIEIKRKAILLNVISIIGILNLVPLGISAVFRDKLHLGFSI